MTLVEFLAARLDDDEAVAQRAARWNEGCRDWATDGEPDWEHIARHDPARVLREVEAKRRIVAMHEGEHECRDIRTGVYPPDAHLMGETPGEPWMHYATDYFEGEPCATLRVLALPYVDCEGFKDEWRP